MLKYLPILIALVVSGCVTPQSVQKQAVGYVFTDGFPGEKHTYVRGVPFKDYTWEVAEDACINYTRSVSLEATKIIPCQEQATTSPDKATKLEHTPVICTTVYRPSSTTEYCWVTERAENLRQPGMLLINREPTTIVYGPVYVH